MFIDSYQTSPQKVSRKARSVSFGRMAVWLIIGISVFSLLVGLTGSYQSVRYPGAERQPASQFQLRFQPPGSLIQQNAYQTPDDLPQVLGWYTQQFGLVHEMPQGDHCVAMTRMDPNGFLHRSLTVTLCTHPTQTLIFIDRSLAVR